MSTDRKSPFEGVAIVRLRPLFVVLTALYFAAYVWYFGPSAIIFGGIFFQANVLFYLYLSPARWLRREVPARIGVRDDHLLVDGNPVCRLRAITSVSVVASDGEARTVSLERRWGRAVVLRVRDEDHVAALMHALGLGPTQWAASYALPPQRGDWRSPLLLGLVTGVFLLVGALERPLLAARSVVSIPAVSIPAADPRCVASRAACDQNARILAYLAHERAEIAHDLAVSTFEFRLRTTMIMLWLVVLGFSVATSAFKPRLMVGADGISLTFKRRTRFVPYDEIANVTVVGSRVTIALTTGEMLAFNTGGGGIVERIREAKAAVSCDADVHALLLRCSGSPAARIHALRAFGREGGEGEYRSAPVTTEQLWRTFESSSADPEARANAAIALRARLDDSCRRRLCIVAAATAAPKLRSAIESAAGDDDESLEEALAAMESDVVEEQAVQRVEAR